MNATNQLGSILHAIKIYTIAEPQSFWAMVQAIGIIVTLWFIWRQLRLQSTANMLSALSEFSAEWWSPDLKSARKEVCQSFRDDKVMGNLAAERVCGFFEKLGLYHKRNIVDSHLAWEMYSYYVEHYWPILEPTLLDLRKDDKTIFTAFELFHKDMKHFSKKLKVPCDDKRPDVLKDFAKSELARK